MSQIDYQKADIQTLNIPQVTGRGTGSQSVTPAIGNTVYDKTSKALYVGDGTNFIGSWGSSTLPTDVTLAAIGAVPNANGATLTGQALNLQPASASFGGVLTTGAQSIAGTKTMVVASNITGFAAGISSGLDQILKYDFAGLSASGGIIAGPQNAAAQRLNNQIFFHIGPLTQAAGAVGGVVTLSEPMPLEMRPNPASLYRSGVCQVIDNNVPRLGAFRIDAVTGVMTIGLAINNLGVLTPFVGGAGPTGILDNCICISAY